MHISAALSLGWVVTYTVSYCNSQNLIAALQTLKPVTHTYVHTHNLKWWEGFLNQWNENCPGKEVFQLCLIQGTTLHHQQHCCSGKKLVTAEPFKAHSTCTRNWIRTLWKSGDVQTWQPSAHIKSTLLGFTVAVTQVKSTMWIGPYSFCSPSGHLGLHCCHVTTKATDYQFVFACLAILSMHALRSP